MDLPATREQGSEAVIGHELVIVTASSINVVAWPASDEIVVGRTPDAQVRLEGTAVSRRHAVFRRDGDGFSVEDLGSANGSFLGGARLAPNVRVPIQLGDAIHIGDHALLLRGVHASEDPVASGSTSEAPIIASEVMRQLYARTDAIAASQLNVLVLGETGVGKDVFARQLHERSTRRACAFVRVNCASLNEPLLESELFGHMRGAFTGAVSDKPGLLETAAGGTVFLDEVGELSPAIQAKLLHVIETREVLRVGSVRARELDVRFVAATNREIAGEGATGRFRSDLYYRLAGYTARIPPLRDRGDEILPLAEELMRRTARAMGRPTSPISEDAARRLLDHAWPGNVRELRNTIDRAFVLAAGGPITAQHLPSDLLASAPGAERAADAADANDDGATAFGFSPDELAERERLITALKAASGNQSLAARALGVSRSTLLNRLDALRIARPRKRPMF